MLTRKKKDSELQHKDAGVQELPAKRFGRGKKSKDNRDSHEDFELSLPQRVIFGYYAHIKKKDLLNYLNAKSHATLAVNDTFYAVEAYKDGFLWELHEGGSGRGTLSSIKSMLKDGESSIVVKSANGLIRIATNDVKGTIDCFNLSDDEVSEQTEGVVFSDKMTPIVNKGYGLFITGTILFSLSVLSLFLSVLFKYVLFNENAEMKLYNSKMKPPIVKYDELAMLSSTKTQGDLIYAKSLQLVGGKFIVNKTRKPKTTKDEDISEELLEKLNQSKLKTSTNEMETKSSTTLEVDKKSALESSIQKTQKEGGKNEQAKQ